MDGEPRSGIPEFGCHRLIVSSRIFLQFEKTADGGGLIQFFTEKVQSCDSIGNSLPFIRSAVMILRQLLDASVDSSLRRLNEHGQTREIGLDDRGFIEALPAILPCHSKNPWCKPFTPSDKVRWAGPVHALNGVWKASMQKRDWDAPNNANGHPRTRSS